MPRNPGSGVYYILPGTEGFPNTTIESEKYNNYIHDVEADLNRPRPIVAGGTGADDADEALANIGGEKSSQKVLDYNNHVFLPGSFYSLAGATNAPINGHNFVGWAVSSDIPATPPANLNVVLRAYDQSSTLIPGRIYVREKKAGTWTTSGWAVDGGGIASVDPPPDPLPGTLWWDSTQGAGGGHLYIFYDDGTSRQWVIASPFADPKEFLLKAGDTMLGPLTLQAAPTVDLQAANKKYVDDKIIAAAAAIDLTGYVAKTGAQTMAGPLTVTGAVTTGTITCGNVNSSGSIFVAGVVNATAGVNAPGGLNANGGDIRLYRSGSPTSGALYFGNSTASYIYYDGNNWTQTGGTNWNYGGNVLCGGTVYSGQNFWSTTSNCVLAANAGAIFLRPHGAGNAAWQATIDGSGNFTLYGGSFAPGHGYNGGFVCKTGDGNAQTGGYFNISWQAPYTQFYIDNTYIGAITVSDYRTKKDIVSLPSTWNAVKALHPIKYSLREFTPAWEKDNASKRGGKPFVENNDDERWGFVAHELQEALLPTAATGRKDAVNVLQSPDLLPVVAALTKALQEAMERIEKLEARA